jgi:hypothetical protein
MRQAGQSKKMAELRLSFDERKTITILIWFFPFLKRVYIFGTLYIRRRVNQIKPTGTTAQTGLRSPRDEVSTSHTFRHTPAKTPLNE